jgi:hypothetical protein
MNCPKCGGDNQISWGGGYCTKCDMNRVNRICHNIWGSDLSAGNDWTSKDVGHEEKPKGIRIFGFKIGD